MGSREDILQSIRRATHVKYEKPDLKPLEDMALTYPSKVEQFLFRHEASRRRSHFFGKRGERE